MGTQNSGANGKLKDSLVMGQTSQGAELHATLLRLTRYQAVFEIYNPALVLRTSEVLADFKVIVGDRMIYSGRAVVTNVVNTGTMIVCETKLDDVGFSVTSFAAFGDGSKQATFSEFLAQWQKLYKVRPEFKVIVADMQTFLADLRLWLDQIELEIRSSPAGDRIEVEHQMVRDLGESIVPAFDGMHERLEALSAEIEEELRPVHQTFSKRQLHPLVLCSPFAYRAYHKPLGYAGDYEMINMIAREPYEGGSLFAKVVNLWFLNQWPAKAHRNRIDYLRNLLSQESLRGIRHQRPLQILNLGCGPAREVQLFLKEDELCEYVQLDLLDFNTETIDHASRVLQDIKNAWGRRTQIQIQKKSVHQVLREGTKSMATGEGKKYDLIYCAGLFDYLSDHTCKQLTNIFFEWLAPGGLLAATNVDDSRPFRHMLEFVLDWHLIYRDVKRVGALAPSRAPAENSRVQKDSTGVNVFLEVRKPNG